MQQGKYRIVHRCRYAIAGRAKACRLVVRLTPLTLPHQAVEELHQLVVRPLPTSRTSSLDVFGNPCARVELRGDLGTVDITAISVVRMSEPAEAPAELSTDWQAVAARTRETTRGDETLAASVSGHDEGDPQTRYAYGPAGSRRTPAMDELASYARASFPPGRAISEAVRDLVGRIGRDFVFDTTATSVDTPLATFWEQRRGVCQDFTHLTLSCLRSLGLRARYASGYVRPSGAPVRASHAWAAIWLPSSGFYDLDPTSATLGPRGHIALGYGRDYDDVAPLQGTSDGSSGARLDTTIAVSPT